jgi:hypothetical protein
MTKLNTEQQSLVFSPAPSLEMEAAHRLVVLVSTLEADPIPVTHRVWELASVIGARVKFLGLCNDASQEPGLRRSLATVSAMMRSGEVSADAEVILGRDWLEVVKSRCQPGDVVVCWNEERAGLLRQLSQLLQSDLDVPVYVLSGLHPQNDPRPGWPARAAAWIGSIAILLGFFVLQVRIVDLAKDRTTVLQLLSLFVAAWLLWTWNRLLG